MYTYKYGEISKKIYKICELCVSYSLVNFYISQNYCVKFDIIKISELCGHFFN